MAGRKPLPTHLELVKGTARPHRLNEAEPKPVVVTPAPPDHLDDDAKVKFTAVAELLSRHGVMTELDTGALARYVVIWRRWLEVDDLEADRRGQGNAGAAERDPAAAHERMDRANHPLARHVRVGER